MKHKRVRERKSLITLQKLNIIIKMARGREKDLIKMTATALDSHLGNIRVVHWHRYPGIIWSGLQERKCLLPNRNNPLIENVLDDVVNNIWVEQKRRLFVRMWCKESPPQLPPQMSWIYMGIYTRKAGSNDLHTRSNFSQRMPHLSMDLGLR